MVALMVGPQLQYMNLRAPFSPACQVPFSAVCTLAMPPWSEHPELPRAPMQGSLELFLPRGTDLY